MSNPQGPDEEQDPAIKSGEGTPEDESPERRFTAPSGFDGSTQIIDAVPEFPTEIISVDPAVDSDAATEFIPVPPGGAPKNVAPQAIPPRGEAGAPPRARRSWGWVIAVVLVIAALVALAVLGTVLLTRKNSASASQEDQVRTTIGNFDVAIQKGDLATLRSITCGATRDSYVQYDDKAWAETHTRVTAAKQYPVVASVDQVVVNDGHAEANVTTFMAYAPQTRSTRSFDLQFRDDQWKICQNS
jgi:flagellar basal body-associated protein FliL